MSTRRDNSYLIEEKLVFLYLDYGRHGTFLHAITAGNTRVLIDNNRLILNDIQNVV
jgi:hypothetical protein